MSIVWIIGSLYYLIFHELKDKNIEQLLKKHPAITILVPCYNEAATIERTCKNLICLDYPNYQVIFIDDYSKDNTRDILSSYTDKLSFFHLISLNENQGKAGALNTALECVRTPFVLILDADTIINGNTLKYLVMPFFYKSKLCAVTANPIPYNRKSFLSKIQTVEFSSIIGLIKRSQSITGHLFTVSGCSTLYNTDILKKVNGFSTITATEDIDVTWRIQRAGYKVWFQPHAIALIQVPKTLREYWKQRKRWATGGWHFLRTHIDIFFNIRLIYLWPLFIDFILSYLWAFSFTIVLTVWIVSLFTSVNADIIQNVFVNGSALSIICVIQMFFAVLINVKYDKDLKKYLYWTPWYPIFFFLIGALLIIWSAPKSLFGNLEDSGKWNSPKRN